MIKIELYRSENDEHNDGRWRWRTRCPENGNILARSSEGYHNKVDAVRMIIRHFGPEVEFDQVSA